MPSRSRKLTTKNRRNSSKTLKRNSRKSLKRNTRKTLKRNVRKTLKRNTRKTLKRNTRKTKRSRRVNMRGGMIRIKKKVRKDARSPSPAAPSSRQITRSPSPNPVRAPSPNPVRAPAHSNALQYIGTSISKCLGGRCGGVIRFSSAQISQIKVELDNGKLWTIGPSLLFPYIEERIQEEERRYDGFSLGYMEVNHDFGPRHGGLRKMYINHNSDVYTQPTHITYRQQEEVRNIIDLVTKGWADVNSINPVNKEGVSQINAYLTYPQRWGPGPIDQGKTAVVIHDINFNDFDDSFCIGIVGRTYPNVYLLDGKSDEGVKLDVINKLPEIFNTVNGTKSIKGSYDMENIKDLIEELSVMFGIDVYLICAPTSKIKGFLDSLRDKISNVILQGSWNPSMRLYGTAIPWGGQFVSFESMMPYGFKLKDDGVELIFERNSQGAINFMYFVLLGGALELGSNFRRAKKYLELKAIAIDGTSGYPPKSLNRWLMTDDYELTLEYSTKDESLLGVDLLRGLDEIDIRKYRPEGSTLHVYTSPEDYRIPLEAASIHNYASLLDDAGLTGQKRDNEGKLLEKKQKKAEEKGIRPGNNRYPQPNKWNTKSFSAWVSHKSQDKSVSVIDVLTGYGYLENMVI